MPETNTRILQHSITPVRAWLVRLGYFLLAAIPVGLLTRELWLEKLPGRFVYPQHFHLFKFLYHFQEALLVGFVVTSIGVIAGQVSSRWIRFAIYLPLSIWIAWLFVWALVHSAFTLDLSWQYAIALLLDPAAISALGLERGFFYGVLGTGLGFFVANSIAGSYLSGAVSRRFAWGLLGVMLTLLVTIHVPVRAWVVYHLNRNQQGIRALDDWSPLALRSEELIPGLRPHRPQLPNLENSQRTRAYLEWVKRAPKPTAPRKIDIVWIVIEAFRADAIDEKATPYLWSHASDFQLKLNRNHWSGGNASQFGLFSMFTGISGYHLHTFTREHIGIPFFELLAANDYRIRIASKHYFAFEQFLPSVFPKTAIWGHPRGDTLDQADRAMVDEWLEDFRSRPSGPSLDVIPFDATHWPFQFAPEDRIFEPSATPDRKFHFTRTKPEAQQAHNAFRNASHGVDRQIARVMEALRERGALDRTIVIITGDHGEEFLERGQIFHAGPTNDFQGRPVLWIHFPEPAMQEVSGDDLTCHTDLVPTLIETLGFKKDVLRTQGQSLLHPAKSREALMTSEQGYLVPGYHALITRDYISRWCHGPKKLLFSGVERRDGAQVIGEEWLEEARRVYSGAAAQYEVLPDPTSAPIQF